MFIAIKDKGARLRRSRMFIFFSRHVAPTERVVFLLKRESYKHLAALRPSQESTTRYYPTTFRIGWFC